MGQININLLVLPKPKLKLGLEQGYNPTRRKCGRVVDCTGLENRRLERAREFESHRFRQGFIPLFFCNLDFAARDSGFGVLPRPCACLT